MSAGNTGKKETKWALMGGVGTLPYIAMYACEVRSALMADVR